MNLEVLLLDGVNTIKYPTYHSDAFWVTKVYNKGKQALDHRKRPENKHFENRFFNILESRIFSDFSD